jgi:hypothetical protein
MGNGIEFNCFNSDINSLEAAVKERLFYVKDDRGEFVRPPQPVPGVFNQLLGSEYEFFSCNRKIVSPLTKEQFLGAYDGRKRTIYEKAFQSLEQIPLNRKDAFVKYFMKVEKVNFTAKPNAVPRGISPRDPRYHVTLGPLLKRIEKPIFKLIDKLWGEPVVYKGMNVDQRGNAIMKAWAKYHDPVAIMLDAKRFDQHVSYEALKFEHSIYKLFYQHTRHLSLLNRLLEWQLVNIGKARAQDGHLSFTLTGGRMSGDMNTSLGNVLLMCSILHAFKRKFKLPMSLVNDGDDCVIITNRKYLSVIRENLYSFVLQFGFQLEIEKPVFELEHIDFCQCRPVMIDDGVCRMVRNPHTSMSKDSVSVLPLQNEKTSRKWCRAIGLCGLALTSGVPVVQVYYRTFSRQSSEALTMPDTYKSGMYRLAKGLGFRPFVTPSPVARHSYWKAFGVTPDEQQLQEQYLDGVDIDHKVTNNYLEVPNILRLKG